MDAREKVKATKHLVTTRQLGAAALHVAEWEHVMALRRVDRLRSRAEHGATG